MRARRWIVLMAALWCLACSNRLHAQFVLEDQTRSTWVFAEECFKGMCTSVSDSESAPDFDAFDSDIAVEIGYFPFQYGEGMAQQSSTLGPSALLVSGSVKARSIVDDVVVPASASGEASSSFSVTLSVVTPTIVHLRGFIARVGTSSLGVPTRVALRSTGGGTIFEREAGGATPVAQIAFETELAPGSYVLEVEAVAEALQDGGTLGLFDVALAAGPLPRVCPDGNWALASVARDVSVVGTVSGYDGSCEDSDDASSDQAGLFDETVSESCRGSTRARQRSLVNVMRVEAVSDVQANASAFLSESVSGDAASQCEVTFSVGEPTEVVIFGAVGSIALEATGSATMSLVRQGGAVVFDATSSDSIEVVSMVVELIAGTYTLAVDATSEAQASNESSSTAAAAFGVTIRTSCAGCLGDVSFDGEISIDDLLAVLADWGPCRGCQSDVTGDGIVSIDDLLIVLGLGVLPMRWRRERTTQTHGIVAAVAVGL